MGGYHFNLFFFFSFHIFFYVTPNFTSKIRPLCVVNSINIDSVIRYRVQFMYYKRLFMCISFLVGFLLCKSTNLVWLRKSKWRSYFYVFFLFLPVLFFIFRKFKGKLKVFLICKLTQNTPTQTFFCLYFF